MRGLVADWQILTKMGRGTQQPPARRQLADAHLAFSQCFLAGEALFEYYWRSPYPVENRAIRR